MIYDCRLVEVARAAQALAPRVAPSIHIKKVIVHSSEVKDLRFFHIFAFNLSASSLG
jgi:hypothetical protein